MSVRAPLPDLYVLASTKPRVKSLLDGSLLPGGSDPIVEEIVAAATSSAPAWSWTVAGGEPTTRSDLPTLLTALSRAGAPRLGLRTDGLALTKISAIEPLKAAGLKRVVVPLHSGRSDAHDWLVQTPGAARRVRRAIQIISSRGIAVEAEVVITRSTTPYLDETVQLLAQLGARAIHFRRPVLTHLGVQAISLSPRFGLLQPYLTEAIRSARSRGLAVHLHDLPRCASPAGFDAAGPTRPMAWCVPTSLNWQPAIPSSGRTDCGDCPASCHGAPQDYVDLFNVTEFSSVTSAPEPEDTPDGSAVVPAPASRNGWQPATRVSVTAERARFGPPSRSPLPADHQPIVTLH